MGVRGKSMRNKTLTLPVKGKWFDMINEGLKKEEYREIKPYYTSRFLYESSNTFKEYDKLVLTRGYPSKKDSARRLIFNNPRIEEREGKEEWGAEPHKKYYVITWELAMAAYKQRQRRRP